MESLPLFFTQWMVRALALLAVAGVASLAARKAGAAVRHAVWIAAAAGMLMLPVLQLTAPELRVPVWIERTAPSAEMAAIEPLLMEMPEAAVVTTVQPQPPPKPVDYGAILLAAYFAGVAILLTRQVSSSMKLRRLVRDAATVKPDSLTDAAQAVGYTGKLPEVKESSAVRVPFTCGVGEPAIILPEDWREWPSMKLFAVLAHENAHVARRDWLTARLAAVNKAVNWWNPAAWWLERHLAAEAEEAVDEMALAAVGDVKQYASAVVDFAIAMQGQRLGSMEATAMARSTKVGRRVERILASNAAGVRSLRRSVILMIAAAAVPIVVLAASALPEVRHVGPSEELVAISYSPSSPEIAQPATGLPAQAAPANREVGDQAPDDVKVRYTRMIEHWTAGATDLARAATWWLIENAPSRMEAATATLMWLAPGPRSADEAERQRLRQAWSQQAQKHSANASVQANAAQIANSFQARFEAEELLIRARRLEPENESYLTRLATLYAFALPELNNNPNPSPESTAFQSKVLSELETTTDAQLVGLVGERLIVGPIVISAGQSAESEAPLRDRLRRRQQLAAKYLGRARTLDPNNEHWAALMRRAADEPMVIRFPDPAPGVRRITVGGGVQQAKTKKTVDPEYPLQALAAGIQGVVRFYVVIGTDGTIQHLIPTEGHSLLLPAAIDAVKQWIYQPTLLNGVPVEVVTQVDVYFNTPRSPAAAEAAGALRIGGGVSAPVPIRRVQPDFPKGVAPEIQHALVLLSIVIAKDGSVTNVEPQRGDPAFFENAIEAVKQWKFSPGMKDGEPLPVKANVEVNFRKF